MPHLKPFVWFFYCFSFFVLVLLMMMKIYFLK